MKRNYVWFNLTTNQRTTDPDKAIVWWKRGDYLRCILEEGSAQNEP